MPHPIDPRPPSRAGSLLLGAALGSLVLTLTGGCVPPFPDPPDAALATTGADTSSGGDETGGISTVTGVTTTETGAGESEGSGPTADAPPVIEAFTLDGAAGAAIVDHAGVTTLEVIAIDDRAVERVRIFDGEALLMTLSGPSLRGEWVIDDVIAATPRTLRAIAEDDRGQASAPVELSVGFAMPAAGDLRWLDAGSALHAGEARGIVRDGASVIAVGVRGLDPDAAYTHALLRIYDAETGDVMINAAHPKPGTPATFRANAVAVTPTGEIAVAGAGTPPGEAAPRPWIALFSASGALLRERLEATPGGEALALVAGDDGLFVAGRGDDDRLFLRRSGLDLAEVWTIRDDAPEHTASELRALVRDDDGDLYAAGTVIGAAIPARVFAGRYSADGAVRWGGRVDCEGIESDHGRAIALGDGGDVLIAAAMVTEGGLRVELRWLDAASGGHLSASLLPADQSEGDEVVGAVAVDRHGRVYLSATLSSAAGADAAVYKRSSDGGAAIWERIVDSPEQGDDHGLSLAVGDDGVVVVGGSLSGEGWPRWWVQTFEP